MKIFKPTGCLALAVVCLVTFSATSCKKTKSAVSEPPVVEDTGLGQQNDIPANDQQHATPTGEIIKVGDSVAISWMATWYLGRVTALKGEKYEVLLADNATAVADSKNIKLMPSDPELAVGEKVLALWGTVGLYPAVILAIKPEGFQVKWEDGSAPSIVTKGRIIKKWY